MKKLVYKFNCLVRRIKHDVQAYVHLLEWRRGVKNGTIIPNKTKPWKNKVERHYD